ncbi:tetratricopeptide repeat protein [Crocosphaera sp.]|uniref:tetratricopeptide repeat protein n=1 Tax=Crocosphaera sp. TaxID=2729996 RepID=UPI0026361EF4|nr:tetratricopeptide repeat protein [Crocosphaera sp.]MDJ0580277.1 tetratricopeptide repeat protein [Crocosphaera sp.]
MLNKFREQTVFKGNWLLSLLVSVGVWQFSVPVMAQMLLPYSPQLNSEQLEQQGLEVAQEAAQLIRFQQHDLALSRAKLAAQLAPNQYQPWFILGTLYIIKQELEPGVEALEKALILEPEEVGIKFTLGNAYFQQGKYQQAAKELEEGLEIKPDVPSAKFDLGNAYFKLERMAEAIAVYQKAIDQQAEFWPAVNNIGLIKYEQGNISSAIEHWQKALEIDEEQAEPILALGVALYVQGKKEEGIKLGETALQLDSSYGEIQHLIDNLWGEKLVKDTQTFFATPQMQAVLTKLEIDSSSMAEDQQQTRDN